MATTNPTGRAHDRSGPFAGVLIADLTHALSGPFCTMLLAELGARVVKVERPPGGDLARAFSPTVDGQSVFFVAVNRGKESIALDLDHHPDRELFVNLVRRADVVVENFRPGTLEHHGFGYDALREINPRIVLASISGFGSTGPDHWEGAYDTVIQAMSGLMSVTGFPDGPATMVGDAIADCLTGTFTFGAIGAALFDRERTGVGAHIDIAMLDCLFSTLQNGLAKYLGTGAIPQRIGNQLTLCAPFGVYRTKEGDLAICIGDELGFGRLTTAIGAPELITDARFANNDARLANLNALRTALEKGLAAHTAPQWLEILQHINIPCGVVNTIAQAAEDPQTVARNMVLRVGAMRAPGNPIKMNTLDDPPERPPAPLLDGNGPALRRELSNGGGKGSGRA
jgi:CoA:oxalate CoA-transferase